MSSKTERLRVIGQMLAKMDGYTHDMQEYTTEMRIEAAIKGSDLYTLHLKHEIEWLIEEVAATEGRTAALARQTRH